MAAPNTTAVAVQKPTTLAEFFASDDARKYYEPFLPEGTDIKRVIASVMMAIQKDNADAIAKGKARGMLGQCTPQSLVLGVARIHQWGLELGTTAHLIPFGKVATPVADYKGLAELMIASGAVRYVDARPVYQGDSFKYRYGLEPMIEHIPSSDRTQKAPITHAYCILHLPFGRFAFEVMSAVEIEAIRQQHSKQWKAGPLPGWYAKKTVIRQTAKLLPKNPRLAGFFRALESDRAEEFEVDADPTLAKAVTLRDEDEDKVEAPECDPDGVVLDEREPGDDETQSVPF